MSSRLRRYFDILVLHETELWSQVERRTSGSGTVNLARFEILSAAATTPECRIQDIADQLRITVGAASRLADRVEADGLVVRLPHPTDRRSSTIEPTELGRTALAATESSMDRALEELLGEVDESELSVLTAFLERVHKLLDAAASRLEESSRVSSAEPAASTPDKNRNPHERDLDHAEHGAAAGGP